MALVLRLVKGTELTFTELDGNFTYLNTTKYESGDDAQFGQLNFSTLSDGVLQILAFTNDPTLNSIDGSVILPTEEAVKSYVASYHTNNPYSFSELNDSSGAGFLGAVLIHDGSNYVPKALEITDFSDFDVSTVSDGSILAYDAQTSLWTATSAAALSSVYLNDLVNVNVTGASENDVLAFDGSFWVSTSPVLEIENLTDVNYLTTPKAGESLIYDDVLEQWIPGTPATVGKLTVSAALNTNITAGKAVTVGRQNNRTVVFPISYLPPEFGQSETVGNQLGAQTHSLWLSSQKKFIVAFINATTGAGEFVIGEVDDDGVEITMDTTVHEFATGVGGEFSVTYDIATTRVIFAWKDIITNIGYTRVVTIAGFAVSMSQFPIDFSLGEAIGSHSVSSDTQSGNLIFHYADNSLNGGGVGIGRVGEIDGLDVLFQPPTAFTTREVYDLHTVYAPTTNRHVTVFTDQISEGYSMVTLLTGVFATYRTPRTFDDDLSFPFVTILPDGSSCWVAYKDNTVSPPRGKVTRFTASATGTSTVTDNSLYSRYFFEDGTGSGPTPYNMSNIRPAVLASTTDRAAVILWGRENSDTNDIELFTTTIAYSEWSGRPIVDIDGAEAASDDTYDSFIINGSIHPASTSGLTESRMIVPLDLATGVRAITYGNNPVTNIKDWFGIADESFSSGSSDYNSGIITILGGQTKVTSWIGGSQPSNFVPGTPIYIDNSRLYRGSLRTSDVGSGAIGISIDASTVLITGDVEPNPSIAGIPKSITELEDVDTLSTAPLSQQFLQWNTNAQKWVPAYASVTGQISNLDDVDTYNGFEAGIPKSHLLAWDNFNIEWVPKSINQILIDEPVELGELSNVNFVQVNDGDLLTYNGPTQTWISSPVNLETDLGDINDVDLTTGLATGTYLQYDGANWVPGQAVSTMPRFRDLADTGGQWSGQQGMVPIFNTTGTYANQFTLGFVSNFGGIGDLFDVDTSTISPQPGQSLVWNGTKWAPATITGGGGGSTGGGDTGGGTTTTPSPNPDGGGGSTGGTVETEDGDIIEIPSLDVDEDIEEPIETGTGFVSETVTNTDTVPATDVIPENVKPGDLFQTPSLSKPYPVVYSISEDRTELTLSENISTSQFEAIIFATPPVYQVVATTGTVEVGQGVVGTESTSEIFLDTPLPEEIVPGHAVYIGSNVNIPIVSGISGDRLSFAVSYDIDITAGATIIFKVVIPMAISQDVGSFVNNNPAGTTGSNTIVLNDPVGPDVEVNHYVMHSELESAPRVVFISTDRLSITVNKNVDALVDGQFITFGSTTSKQQEVTFTLAELSDTDIQTAALQDGEVLLWNYENQVWTTSDVQLSNSLDALNDVRIDNPQEGQILRYTTLADANRYENIDPSFGAGALADFNYNIANQASNNILTWHAPSSAFISTPIGEVMRASDYTMNNLADVTGVPFDGSALVYDSNTGFYSSASFPDSIYDLADVAGLPEPSDALVWNGASWSPAPIPRALEDLNERSIFLLNQLNENGFQNLGNTPSSKFLKWTGTTIDTVVTGSIEGIGLRLEDLDDVSITEPYNSDFISWDPDTNSWVTRSVEGAVISIGLDVLTDVDFQAVPPQNRNTLEYNASTGEWRPATRSGVANYIAAENLSAGDLLALRSDGEVEKIAEIESSVSSIFQASGSPSVSSDYYGKSVFVSDDYYIVGAPGYEYLTVGGKVEIFSTSTNTLVQTINNPNATANDKFGESVSISSQFFTIGAPGYDSNAGRIYVYSLPGFILEHTIDNPNAATSTLDDQFGFRVQNTNTYVAVTAINEEPQSLSDTNSGTVYVFNTATGNQLGFVENPSPSITGFGSAISISTSGDLAIGSPSEEKVYVYEAATLSSIYTISNPGGAGDFGSSIAISSDGRMVVGAPTADTGSGKLYIYNLNNGDFNYTLNNPNRNADVPTGDNFGSSVAVTTEYILASASGENVGSVYLFEAASGAFRNEFLSDEGATNINWGFGLALTNDYLIIGSPRLTVAGTGKIATFASDSFIESNAGDWVGISEQSVEATQQVTVTTVGAVNKFVSGLTINKNYYIDGRGFITETETDYGVLGKALAADELLITGNVVSAETGVTYINDIRDVDTVTVPPSNNQGLVWDSANNRWAPKNIGYSNITTFGGLTDTSVGGVQAGQGLKYSGSSWGLATYIEAGTLSLSSLSDVDTSGVVDNAALVYSLQFDEWQASVIPIPATINDLNDIDLSTVSAVNNDVLVYNANSELWEPGQVSRVSALGDLIDVDLASQPPVQDNVIAYQAGVGWTPVQITNITVTQLDNMDDVRTAGLYAPVPGETLIWNGIEGVWEPGSPALDTISIGSLSDVDTTPGTASEPSFGEFLAWDGVNWSPGSTAPTAATLNSLLDVEVIANPAKEKEVLTYDATTQKWYPRAGHSGGIENFIANGDISDGDIVSITPPGKVKKTGQEPFLPAWNVENPTIFGTATSDQFTSAVVASGDYIIAGAQYEDEIEGSSSGVVYVFNNFGTQQYYIKNENINNPVTGDRFGNSLDASGNLLAVGSLLADDLTGYNQGAAYVYRLATGTSPSGDLWLSIQNPDGTNNAQFGTDVAISDYNGEARLAVGAPLEDMSDQYSEAGCVYFFDPDIGVGDPQYGFLYRIDNPNTVGSISGDYFGQRVSLTQDRKYLAVTASREGTTSVKGYVYIYDVSSDSLPVLLHTISNPNPGGGSDATHGFDIVWDRNPSIKRLAISAPEQDFTGANEGLVYIYDVTDEACTLINTIQNPDTYPLPQGDEFGYSIDMKDNKILVGARREDQGYIGGVYTNAGKAYYFEADTGTPIAYFDNPNIYGNSTTEYFGSSVAIGNDKLYVGAPFARNTISGDFNSGHLTAFDINITSNASSWIGVAFEDILDGDVGQVTLFGGIAHNQVNLLPGQNYYLNIDGTLNSSPTNLGIFGKALSANDILITGDVESNTADQVNNLNDLGDVTAFASDGQALVWNAQSSQWVAGDAAGGVSSLSDLDDINLPIPSNIQTGEVLTWNAVSQSFVNAVTGSSNVDVLDDLTDVDLSSVLPSALQILQYNGSIWSPQDLPEGQRITGIAAEQILQGGLVVLNSSGQFENPTITAGELVSSFPSSSDLGLFGHTIAEEGGRVAVSAPYHRIGPNSGVATGLVRIYDTDNSTLIRTLQPSLSLTTPAAWRGETNQAFGFAVAIKDDYAVVGSPLKDLDAVNSGVVYVYRISSGTLIAVLESPEPLLQGQFGSSVAINSTYVAVGAPRVDIGNNALVGKVYRYPISLLESSEYGIPEGETEARWDPLLVPDFTFNNNNDDGGTGGDLFGSALSATDTYLSIGAPGEDTGGQLSTGRIYVRNINTGSTIHTLQDTNIGSNGLGFTFEMDDSIIVAGTPDFNGGLGRVLVYSTTSGAVLAEINSPDQIGDKFGRSVGLGSSQIVVGSEANNDVLGYNDSGKFYSYNRASTTSYPLYAAFENPGYVVNPSGSLFGFSVAVTNSGRAIVGAPYNDNVQGTQQFPATDRGVFFIYDVTLQATQSNAADWMGIAEQTAVTGEQLEVVILGGKTSSIYSNLVPGEYYYAGADGSLTLEETSYGIVGPAASVSEILILGSISGVSDMADLADVDFSAGLVPQHGLTWNGQKWVASYVSTVTNLLDLEDVNLLDSPPEDAQGLVYDNNTSKWVPANIGYSNVAQFSDLNNVDVSNATVGQSIEWNGVNWIPTTFSSVNSINDLTDVNTTTLKVDYDILTWSESADEWIIDKRNFGNFLNLEAYAPTQPIQAGDPVYITDDGKVAAIKGTETVLGTESLVNTLYPPVSNSNFGTNLAVSKDIIVVGNPYFTSGNILSTGRAYIYNATSGQLLYTLEPPTDYSLQSFGWGVATNGSEVAITAKESPSNNDYGRIYLYDAYTGALLRQIVNPEDSVSTNGPFAQHNSVVMTSSYLIVGNSNWRDATLGTTPGKAYVFNIFTGTQEYSFNNPNPSNGADFGRYINIDESESIISITDTGTGSSLTHIYELSDYSFRTTIDHSLVGVVADKFALNTNYLITGSNQHGYLSVWSTVSGANLYSKPIISSSGKDIVCNDKQVAVITGSSDGVKYYDIASGLELANFSVGSSFQSGAMYKTKLIHKSNLGEVLNYNLSGIKTNTRAADWVGINESLTYDGDIAKINTGSGVTSSVTNLVTGLNYYVSIDGSLFPGPTGFGKIGRAIDSTTILISSNTSNIDLDEESTAALIAGINDLTDVDIFTSFPADNNFLQYDSSSALWVPGTAAITLLNDVTISNLQDKNLLVYSTDTSSWENSSISTSELSDVDYTTPIESGQTLVWDGNTSSFKPGVTDRSITSLNDVDDQAPSVGQILIWDDISTQWVAQDNVSTLEGLTDVDISGVSNNQFLQYNNVTSLWEPGDVATSIAELTDVNVSGGITDGQYLVYNLNTSVWLPQDLPEFAAAIVDLTDVNADSPTQGQGLIFDDQTNKFELAIVGTSNVDTLDDLSNVSVPAPNDGDVLKYNSNSSAWEATPTPSPAVIYATRASFPSLGNLGDLSFAQDTGALYVWEGTVWYNLKRTNAFYLVRAGNFTGPLEGQQVFQPQQAITLHEIRAQVDQPSGETLIFAVMKNSVEVQQFVMPSAQGIVEAAFTSGVTVGLVDEITLDIISGPGTNLSVKFIYS